ncbi:hypothetical protein ODS41_02650 [Pyrobaculum sp. 3827-6]|uniref:hypothetical protein n=1 Tax=Pyrobaculum sp. 3827-6 TaxID=2983604 RepID=UPI0021DA24B5|nr:hypothetical protein [Pyrobaculum sp. 3827-6]MCU7786829.1 hypothetical protein [Pyrobaculum sp. 3827-6]
MNLRLPPRIKVLEALGALADGRVRVLAPGRCEVVSSEGDKTYTVYVAGGYAYSNDNGTVHRGYVGYPILACLMAEGALPVDRELAERLRGIPWKRLNEQFKKYEEVMRFIYAERGIDRARAESYIASVLGEVEKLRLRFKPPP